MFRGLPWKIWDLAESCSLSSCLSGRSGEGTPLQAMGRTCCKCLEEERSSWVCGAPYGPHGREWPERGSQVANNSLKWGSLAAGLCRGGHVVRCAVQKQWQGGRLGSEDSGPLMRCFLGNCRAPCQGTALATQQTGDGPGTRSRSQCPDL